jgi:hypothetical protein
VTAHIDDMIMVLDNDEIAYTMVREIVFAYEDDGATAVGEEIKELVSRDVREGIGAAVLAEFLGSVSSYELGQHYIDAFAEDREDDEDEEEDEPEVPAWVGKYSGPADLSTNYREGCGK